MIKKKKEGKERGTGSCVSLWCPSPDFPSLLLRLLVFQHRGAVNTLVYASHICIQHHLSWLMARLSPLQPE